MASIDYFRQFLTLAELLNYTAAAESMYMTESALSRHIRALESELGVRLFSRTTQSVSLTAAGELFKKKISSILYDYDDLCTELHSLDSGYSERLKISCPYYSVLDYLGSVPEPFGKKYPEIKLEYYMNDPYESMKSFLEDKVDITIGPVRNIATRSFVEAVPVFDERLGVLINKKDPLAAKEEIFLTDLKDHTFFTIRNPYFSTLWRHVVSLCRKAGFTPKEPSVFNQMEALIMSVRIGEGITVVGRHMRNQESDLVTFKPLSDPEAFRVIGIMYKRNNDNPAIQKFIDFYKETRAEEFLISES